MIRRSRSYHGDVPGSESEELKTNFDLPITLIFDELKNTNNSIKLIDPSILNSLLEETRVVLNQRNWNTVNNESKPKKGPSKTTKLDFKNVETEATLNSTKTIVSQKRESMSISNNEEHKLSKCNRETVNDGLKSIKDPTNVVEMEKLNKYTTLDTKKVEDETALNIQKDEESAALELKESIGKYTHEPKCEATSNKAQGVTNFPDSKEDLIGNEKPSISTESTLEPNDVSAELTSTGNVKKTRASEKKMEIEIARKGFSIENVDWYYKDENNYKKKCRDTLSCFISDGYDEAYTYLLLDSRRCKNRRNIDWLDFISAIVYIGKGIGNRAFDHTSDTEKWLIKNKPSTNSKTVRKFQKIEEIWKNRNPIKVLKVTKNITEYEAYTREAAMIDAVGMDRLCNEARGRYYKQTKTLEATEILELGFTLLMDAWEILKGEKPDIIDVKPKNNVLLNNFFG